MLEVEMSIQSFTQIDTANSGCKTLTLIQTIHTFFLKAKVGCFAKQCKTAKMGCLRMFRGAMQDGENRMLIYKKKETHRVSFYSVLYYFISSVIVFTVRSKSVLKSNSLGLSGLCTISSMRLPSPKGNLP